jgi:hypothetical protein
MGAANHVTTDASKPAITVVSGLPRSGTSLMMQMLHAGGLPALSDGAREPDVDNPRGYYELEAVKRTKQDPSWLNGAHGKVVKMVHLLLPDLPADRNYRILFMRRDIAEVLASQRKMLERQNKRGAAIGDAQLTRLFEDQLAKVTRWMGSQPNVSSLDVHYKKLIEDPATQAASLNAFLGGGLDETAMAAAVDPSLYRNSS